MTSAPKPPPGLPGAAPRSPEPDPEIRAVAGRRPARSPEQAPDARTTGPYRLLPEGAVPPTFSPGRRFRGRAPEGVR
ncbi:hypothetical protein GCM10009525_54830 [Streptosporangium amethystogenes subsp. fukuiense]